MPQDERKEKTAEKVIVENDFELILACDITILIDVICKNASVCISYHKNVLLNTEAGSSIIKIQLPERKRKIFE